MSLAAIPAITPGADPGAELGGGQSWTDWLDRRFPAPWRPAEWDHTLWLFTGDLDHPGTAAWKCFTAACATVVTARRTFCTPCHRAWVPSGQDRGAFAAAYMPPRVKIPRGGIPAPCLISRDEIRCAWPAYCRGMCHRHYKSWDEARRERVLAWPEWESAAVPFPVAVACLVPGCPVSAMTGHGLCAYHSVRFGKDPAGKRAGRDRAAWAAGQVPYLTAEKFSLRPLGEVLRREILYGLQVRDRTGRGVVDPSAMRVMVTALAGVTSLLDDGAAAALARCGSVPNTVARDLRWAAQRGFEQHNGITPTSKNVWDLREIGLKCKTRSGVRFHPGTADVREITQPWLRAVLQHWVESQQPRSDKFGRALRAAVIGSRALQARPDGGTPHLPAGYISEAIRAWVAATPELHGEGVDAAGNRLPFDRSLIFPYAFRHSYAQRHADAGTPVDVLKELMDHRSISTTMGYYQVSLKRKRAAVKALAAEAVDRSGNPAPFNSGLAYQRGSVAVPFGGCTEPSNVKAGGSACPIRFQCAGCGFYRPDPSYLPAIEQHISDLKADRETALAMDAASFVITGLTGQIDAYAEVGATMRQRLAALPGDERAEIEHASAIMRKTRAAAGRTVLPLAVTSPDGA